MKYIGLLTVLLLFSVSCASSPASSSSEPEEVASTVTPTLQELSTEGPGSSVDPADIIYYNGDVITLEEQGVVQAIAIKGNEILAVGSNEDILKLEGNDTLVIDLKGRTLLPGFVEGHSHTLGSSQKQEVSLDEAQDVAFSFGWTSLNELRLEGSTFEEIQQAEQSGELRIRVNAFLQYNRSRLEPDGNSEVLQKYWEVHAPVLDNDKFLRIVGIKVFIDGALVNNPARGCWALTEPYAQEFQQIDYFQQFCNGEEYGSLYLTQDKLNEVVLEIQESGFQVAMHANGDRAIDMALNAIEFVIDGETNEDYRHQIHHSSLLRPDQITRYQELDVIASIRGMFVTCRQENQVFAFGEERYQFIVNRYSLPTLIEHTFAEGDFGWNYDPYTENTHNNPINPLLNLWGFVTRKDIDGEGNICDPQDWAAEHKITVEQGLRLLTIGPAYAVGQDDVLGTLKEGKFADIVIIDRNPLQVEPDDLLNLSVLMTMVGGNVEFCREGNEAYCP